MLLRMLVLQFLMMLGIADTTRVYGAAATDHRHGGGGSAAGTAGTAGIASIGGIRLVVLVIAIVVVVTIVVVGFVQVRPPGG